MKSAASPKFDTAYHNLMSPGSPGPTGSWLTIMWEVLAFSSYASICGDIFISWGPRFSSYGDTVNLSRCSYRPAILTSCVNPQKKKKRKKEKRREQPLRTRRDRRKKKGFSW